MKAIEATATQMAPKVIPIALWFGGLLRFGRTPGGGAIAGPSRIFCCTCGGSLGKFLIRSDMAATLVNMERSMILVNRMKNGYTIQYF